LLVALIVIGLVIIQMLRKR